MENDEAVLTGGREAAGRLQIPFWLKSNLTVDEAAAYSQQKADQAADAG